MDEGSGNESDLFAGITLFFPDGNRFTTKGPLNFTGSSGVGQVLFTIFPVNIL
jgi:hypothetical protein